MEKGNGIRVAEMRRTQKEKWDTVYKRVMEEQYSREVGQVQDKLTNEISTISSAAPRSVSNRQNLLKHCRMYDKTPKTDPEEDSEIMTSEKPGSSLDTRKKDLPRGAGNMTTGMKKTQEWRCNDGRREDKRKIKTGE